jgi:predicted nuclease with TOPRIM domain
MDANWWSVLKDVLSFGVFPIAGVIYFYFQKDLSNQFSMIRQDLTSGLNANRESLIEQRAFFKEEFASHEQRLQRLEDNQQKMQLDIANNYVKTSDLTRIYDQLNEVVGKLERLVDHVNEVQLSYTKDLADCRETRCDSR